ncbi:hypothetical protein V2J09_003178 [Rumex salicifolius]
MANTTNLITRIPSVRSCAFKTTRATPSSLPLSQLNLRSRTKDGANRRLFVNPKNTKLRPYHVVASFSASDDPAFEDAASDLPLTGSHEPDDGNSVSKTIREFYDCINEINLSRLGELISDNCWFDDYSFPEKFDGKKEVCNFFEILTKSMGENVKFQIEEICEGDDHVGCAIWHLEWKHERIPFTRGCTFFRCLTEGDKLLIREARVLIESPFKPGVVVVGLLDLVRSVFDDYPNFTRWFLSSPQALLRILLNVYNLVAAPFINPLLMFYTQIWMLIYKWLCYMTNFLRYIVKNFK